MFFRFGRAIRSVVGRELARASIVPASWQPARYDPKRKDRAARQARDPVLVDRASALLAYVIPGEASARLRPLLSLQEVRSAKYTRREKRWILCALGVAS